MKKKPTDFAAQVIKMIRQIPLGRVATYGQIAQLAGRPSGSRGVVWILHSCSESHALPWHRVLNSKGLISFPEGSAHFKKQKALLRNESIQFKTNNGLDLETYRWKKKPVNVRLKQVGKSKAQPKIFN